MRARSHSRASSASASEEPADRSVLASVACPEAQWRVLLTLRVSLAPHAPVIGRAEEGDEPPTGDDADPASQRDETDNARTRDRQVVRTGGCYGGGCSGVEDRHVGASEGHEAHLGLEGGVVEILTGRGDEEEEAGDDAQDPAGNPERDEAVKSGHRHATGDAHHPKVKHADGGHQEAETCEVDDLGDWPSPF